MTTTMTRQDFELIAGVVASIDSKDNTQTYVAELFADRLAETNPRFDRERFIEAATGQKGTE